MFYFPTNNVLDSEVSCNNEVSINKIDISSFNFTNLISDNDYQNKTFTWIFSSLKLPEETEENSIKIKYNFLEKDKLINVYYNEENIILLI